MTACISIVRYKEFSLPFEMLSSCRLAHSPAYAFGLDLSYIQVSQHEMMLWEGRKLGRNLVPGTWQHTVILHWPVGWRGGCSPQGLLWLIAWALYALGSQLSGSAHLQSVPCSDRRGRDLQKSSLWKFRPAGSFLGGRDPLLGTHSHGPQSLPEQSKGAGLGQSVCAGTHWVLWI